MFVSSDFGLLNETKQMLFKTFSMKHLGEGTFVLDIEIHKYKSHHLLGLSQRAYTNRVLERFNMQNYKLYDTPITKGDKFSKDQYLRNELEKDQMKNAPYASHYKKKSFPWCLKISSKVLQNIAEVFSRCLA